jgi:hypothetical protein
MEETGETRGDMSIRFSQSPMVLGGCLGFVL